MMNYELKKPSSILIKKKQDDQKKYIYGFLKNFHSKHTFKAYQTDLKGYFQFLSDYFPGLDYLNVEQPYSVAYKNLLVEKKLSNRSVNRKLACVSAFYEYLYQFNEVKENPFLRVKRFRIEKKVETNDLSDKEIDLLIESVDRSTGVGKLHFAILVVLFNTGMRQGELIDLKFSNLEVVGEHLVLSYKAKGDKAMRTPLNDKAKNALGDYVNWLKESGECISDGTPIFRPTKNSRGSQLRHLTPKSIHYIFDKYSNKIGLDFKVTPHSSRASVIGKLLDQDISIDKVADFVGHADLSTTRAYYKRKRKIEDSLSLKFL